LAPSLATTGNQIDTMEIYARFAGNAMPAAC
jgi:hypothetical protein